MPDPTGKLTTEEKDAVVKRLTELDQKRGADLACEVCGSNQWNLNPYVLGLMSDRVQLLMNGFRTPTVMIFCDQCGHEKFFIAAKLGVHPLGPDAETLDQGAGGKKADGK